MTKENKQITFDSRAEVLKTLRLDAGYTNVKKYAVLMDVDPSTYARYETCVTIDENNVFKITEFNKISLGAFYVLVQIVTDRKNKKPTAQAVII